MPRGGDGDLLMKEMRAVRSTFEEHGTKLVGRVNMLEESVNDIHRRMQRPGGEYGGGDSAVKHKHATELCLDRKSWSSQKYEGRRDESWLR